MVVGCLLKLARVVGFLQGNLTDPYTYPYISCIILYIHIFIIYPCISSYILIETCHLG